MRAASGACAFALISAAMLIAACASPYYYDRYGYYGWPYYYYDRPYYYGSAYDACYGRYAPSYCFPPPFTGPGAPYRNLRYREGPYGREFWFDGRWVSA